MDQITDMAITTNVFDATTSTSDHLHPLNHKIASDNNHGNCNGSSNTVFNSQEFQTFLYKQQSPRKKRSKLIKTGNDQAVISKPRLSKKPDPFAPKITAPCAVCGRKFWSWKALFGHMRCHPERQWRGINPPEHSIIRPLQQQQHHTCYGEASTSNYISSDSYNRHSKMTEEEHNVAASLLVLANGPSVYETQPPRVSYYDQLELVGFQDEVLLDNIEGRILSSCCRFECSSCKKVFDSHQALGGHRASHRNVKGCFKIARNYDVDNQGVLIGHDHRRINVDQQIVEVSESHPNLHQCSICFKVFSSGQALGGHKRCHWEKADAEESLALNNNVPFGANNVVLSGMLDLNLPALMDDNISSCSYSSPIGLDLRLRL